MSKLPQNSILTEQIQPFPQNRYDHVITTVKSTYVGCILLTNILRSVFNNKKLSLNNRIRGKK